MSLNAFGIDISSKRCKKALARSLASEIEAIPISRRKMLGVHEPMIYKERIASITPWGNWTEMFSERHQRVYWLNQETGEECWKLPGELEDHDSSDAVDDHSFNHSKDVSGDRPLEPSLISPQQSDEDN